ncbi:MAG: putative HNHc nuclease [Vallitalea sp.]|nr:putative HNHc nuclease [Vallitalea sp.]
MLKYGYIDKYKYQDENTILHVEIPEKIQQLKKYSKDGKVLVEMRFNDGRKITNEQRKKFYATIGDIAYETGDTTKSLEDYFKCEYMARTGETEISLSNCSVTAARELINIVIEFCIKNGIILTDTLINRTDDIDRAMYYCIANRKCCITGQRGDLHHCTGSRVGMGNNRKKISHSGRYFLCVNREYHDIVHTIGEKAFFDKHKVYGIKIDDETLEQLGYKVDEIEVHEEVL